MAIGNLMGASRDKRKEFNVSAAPIRAYLVEEIDSPGLRNPPSKSELDTFESRLSWWSRGQFRRAWQNKYDAYKLAYRRDPETGGWKLVDDAPIKSALVRCLRYTKPR